MYLKKLARSIFTSLISIIILGFILTIFYYFNIIDNNIYNVLKMIIILGSLFINAFILGSKSSKYGIVEGLKLGAIFLLIISIIKLVINSSFDIKTLLYFIIILLSTSTASIIGINKKK